MPVKYASNPSALMTDDLWLNWLKWFDSQLTRKSILLADNCPTHVDCSHLKFKYLTVKYSKSNTTSQIQAMDASIIRNF